MANPDPMTDHAIPGLDADVYFGDPRLPLPDWREELPDADADEDALSPEERTAIIGMIGFDPLDEHRQVPLSLSADFEALHPRGKRTTTN